MLRRSTIARDLPLVLCALVLAAGAIGVWVVIRPDFVARLGADLVIYLEATQRWLDGGSFYLERQLSGPYRIETGDVLYPPTTIPLFVPFLVVPVVLWWAIPLVAIGVALWRLRPARWTWPLMLGFVLFPHSLWLVICGNPVLWAVAALALGAVWRWPSALVLLKPTLAPFALLGIRDVRWWVVVGLGVLVALAFLPMWGDYLRVIGNATGLRADPLYSLLDVPLMLVPVVAWLGRDDRRLTDVVERLRATRSDHRPLLDRT